MLAFATGTVGGYCFLNMLMFFKKFPSGHCYVKVDIYFTAIGLIDISTEDEIKSLMAEIKENPQEYRLTA